VTFCEDWATLPHRGRTRDDVRPGLRTIGYRRRVVIAFAVIGQDVLIIGVFYGDRDYEAVLTESEVAAAQVAFLGLELRFFSFGGLVVLAT
jgi:toxin ParE1/3/4